MIHSQNAHPVRQVIKVSGISCAGCEQNIAEALSAINGVLEIRPDHQKDRVEVVYDLRKLRLQTLEDKLDQLGYPLAGGFWTRQKRGFAHFKEQNEFDALTHKGHCCSKPPVGG